MGHGFDFIGVGGGNIRVVWPLGLGANLLDGKSEHFSSVVYIYGRYLALLAYIPNYFPFIMGYVP